MIQSLNHSSFFIQLCLRNLQQSFQRHPFTCCFTRPLETLPVGNGNMVVFCFLVQFIREIYEADGGWTCDRVWWIVTIFQVHFVRLMDARLALGISLDLIATISWSFGTVYFSRYKPTANS